MATYTIYASTTLDYYLIKDDTTWNTVADATDADGSYGSQDILYGGSYFSTGYYAGYEALLCFDTSSIPDNYTVTSVEFSLYMYSVSGTPTTVVVLPYDWADASAGAWLTQAELAVYGTVASWSYSGTGLPTRKTFTIDNASYLNGYINKTGNTKFLVTSSKHRGDTAPTGDDRVAFASGYYGGNNGQSTYSPKLVITAVGPTQTISNQYVLDGVDAIPVFSVKRLFWRGAALAGAASLSPSPVAKATRPRSATLSSAGSIAALWNRIRKTTALLNAAATEASSASATRKVSATLATTGSTLSVGGAVRTRSATLAAAGSISAVKAATFRRSATLSASGTIWAFGQRLRFRTAALAATGSISAIKAATLRRSAALSAVGSLSSSATRTALRSATLAATGTATAIPRPTYRRSATLAATGSLSASATGVRPASATLSGAASISATAVKARFGLATLSASASLSCDRRVTRAASAALLAAAAEAGVGGVIFRRSATLSGAASITASALRTAFRTAALSAVASQVVVAKATRPRSAALSAAGSIATVGGAVRPRSAALSGAAAITCDAAALTPVTYRPTGDVADGGWTTETGGTDLYAAIDEGPYDDNDLIRSSVLPVADACTIAVPCQTPADNDVRIRYRAFSDGAVDLTIAIYEGETLRATRTRSLDGIVQTYTETLTPEEVAAITDWTAIRVRLEASAT